MKRNEDEFPHVAPKGVVPVRDFEPWDDYVPDYEADDGIEMVEGSIIEDAAKLAKRLRLHAPVVYFVEDTESMDHIARFMDGTENTQPTILLAWHHLAPLNYQDQVANTIISLSHELGHAYLRSTGREYEPDEEEIVETFGVMVYEDGPEEAVAYLVGESNPKKLKAKLLR